MSLPPPSSSPVALQAIGLMMVAVFLFAVMDAMIKWQGAVYPVLQIVFFRSAFGLLISIGPVIRDGRRTPVKVPIDLAQAARRRR